MTTVSGTKSVGDMLYDCLVEPLPPPPLSQAAGSVDFGKSSMPGVLASAALTPGIFKHGRTVDKNHLHVSLGHAHDGILRQTAKQHGFRLTGELVSCSTCSNAKGQRASTPHRTTRRATRPRELVHIDNAGPYPATHRGSRYIVMFVDSDSRLQRPYGAREKSAPAILAVVKRFVADMGVAGAFSTDNGTEYTDAIRGILQQSRDPARAYCPTHPTAEWAR